MNRKRIVHGLIGLGALVVVACGLFYWLSRPSQPDLPIAIFGSQRTLDAFLSASDFTAERLHYRRADKQNAWRLSSYDREAPIPLTAGQANTVRHVLTQESTYGWLFAKMCAPSYGVLLTARSGQSTVRIALCFECYMLGVFDSAADTAEDVNGERDFMSPASRDLVGLAKDLFPGDAEIQSLK